MFSGATRTHQGAAPPVLGPEFARALVKCRERIQPVAWAFVQETTSINARQFFLHRLKQEPPHFLPFFVVTPHPLRPQARCCAVVESLRA